ncbi:MAG: hypothetical protein QFB87_04660 [Patescibacteria group bacterium]|nr:hypothetical protein [Patescibacteria group bacterium]
MNDVDTAAMTALPNIAPVKKFSELPNSKPAMSMQGSDMSLTEAYKFSQLNQTEQEQEKI